MLTRTTTGVLAATGAALTGLTVRALTDDVLTDPAGVAMYGAMVYAVVAIRPDARPAPTAAVAVTTCWLIEAFQLTDWPARHADELIVRLTLGTTFSVADLAWYVAGAAAAAAIHWSTRPPRPTQWPSLQLAPLTSNTRMCVRSH